MRTERASMILAESKRINHSGMFLRCITFEYPGGNDSWMDALRNGFVESRSQNVDWGTEGIIEREPVIPVVT